MQLHSHAQAAPGMARSAENEAGKRMQSHAPYRCMAFSVKTGGFSGNFTQTDVMPVAHFYAKKSCSAQE